jgi:PBSX family phage terminase large subunit
MTQIVPIIQKVKQQLVPADKRHKIIYGGRGKGASWSIARILLLEGMKDELFIVCVREVQKSIQYSVQKLLSDTIKLYHWEWFYRVTKTDIRGTNGTLFIFNGLRDHNSDSIKSLEGADRCWVAEAQSISRTSIDILRPTIRKDNAVFWWDFNPRYSSDPIWVDYIRNTDEEAIVLFLSWKDNKWFPKSLVKEMKADYKRDVKRADHIWKGELADENTTFVCPAELVDKAQAEHIKKPFPHVPEVGADIAHQGGDEIVFYKKIEDKIVGQYISTYNNTVDTLRDLKLFAGKNSIIKIDNGHLGCAVADLMEDDGYTVYRIVFGGKPKDVLHYEDCATEMYFEMKDQLQIADIPLDEELAIQLYTRKYDFINGKRGYEVMKIESKKDFSEHTHALHKSPDRADALVMTYYDPSGSMDISGIAGKITAYGGN